MSVLIYNNFRQILSVVLFCLSFTSFSQNTFEKYVPSYDGVFREAEFVVETEDNGFLVCCTAQYLYQNDMLLGLSSDGEIRNQHVFTIDDKFVKYCAVFRHPTNRGEYLAVAMLSEGDSNATLSQNSLALITISADAEIVGWHICEFGHDYQRFCTGNKDLPRFIVDDDGTLVMAAHCKKTEGYSYLFVKMTAEGNVVRMSEDNTLNSSTDLIFDLFPKSKAEHSYSMIKYSSNKGEGGDYYYQIDSLLNCTRETRLSYMNFDHTPVSVAVYPDTTFIYRLYGTGEYFADSLFLVTSGSHYHYFTDNSFTQQVTGSCHFMAILDSEAEPYDFRGWDATEYYGNPNPETERLSAKAKAVSVRDGTIFHCGVKGIDGHNHYAAGLQKPVVITISKFDLELNAIWRRYYGMNDNFYDINVVQATEDGGCVITGISSFVNNYYDFFSYILKVDENGYDAIDENTESLAKPYFCYPNPAKDNLYIEFSPDVNCQSVEIYTLDGRMVETCHGASLQNNTIDISNLNSGVYLMKIRMTDGKEFSERIVKE